MIKTLRHSIRFLPETKGLKMVLNKYVKEAEQRMPSEFNEPRFEIKEEAGYFLLIDKDYHVSNGIESDIPVCNDIIGILQYFLQWTTGHKYDVKEIECRAMGHPADVFRIKKTDM